MSRRGSTLEGTLGAARGPRLHALPGPCERALGIKTAASDEGRGEHRRARCSWEGRGAEGAGPVTLTG